MAEFRAADPAGIRVRVCLAVVRAGRILLLPHYDTDMGPVQWCIPGGRLEYAEGLREAAAREFEEETGLRVRVGELLDVSEVIRAEKRYHSITITYVGEVAGGEVRAEPEHPYGLKAARWFSRQELASLEYHPKGTVEKVLRKGSEIHS